MPRSTESILTDRVKELVETNTVLQQQVSALRLQVQSLEGNQQAGPIPAAPALPKAEPLSNQLASLKRRMDEVEKLVQQLYQSLGDLEMQTLPRQMDEDLGFITAEKERGGA